jgi:hypothetical protein
MFCAITVQTPKSEIDTGSPRAEGSTLYAPVATQRVSIVFTTAFLVWLLASGPIMVKPRILTSSVIYRFCRIKSSVNSNSVSIPVT